MIKKQICIILPVLNEAENAPRLIESLNKNLGNLSYVVCFIDDGSKDGTQQIIRSAQQVAPDKYHLIERVKTHAGSQRGSALRVGMEWGIDHTSCEFFVEMDGDLSHRPEEIADALKKLQANEADVIIASKYQPASRVIKRPLGRRLVSSISSFMVGLVIDRKVRDYSNGFRFYNRRAAQIIQAHHYRYGSPIYLTEVLSLWLKQKLRVLEVPTEYIGRNEGLSKLRWVDLVKAGVAVFEISSRYHVLGFKKMAEKS